MSGYPLPYEGNLLRKDGSKFTARIKGRNEEREGRVFRVTAFVDLTEQKKAEEVLRNAAVHEELIRLQADLLARLSTPLLPIAKGALVLPLIGQINGTRAAQVLDTLTHGVVAHSARHAILDVTGVDTLDAQVADLLVSASKVARLLGAQALLTGIRPDVARMLVDIGSDLGSLMTFATLEQGVSYALRNR
jgi:anti-anti-sigma regulatory factor